MSILSQQKIALLRRVHEGQHRENPLILHYDPQARDLRPWFWPVSRAGRHTSPSRVPPSEWGRHSVSHEFERPSCLCGAGLENQAGARYCESEVNLVITGKYEGEYVASCATNRCGYMIELERLYPKNGLLTKRYTRRDTSAPQGLPNRPNLTGHASNWPDAQSTLDMLLKLDSTFGITLTDLSRLLRKCGQCKKIMTRRVSKQHKCPVVIDLTVGDSDTTSS